MSTPILNNSVKVRRFIMYGLSETKVECWSLRKVFTTVLVVKGFQNDMVGGFSFYHHVATVS